MFQPTYSHNWVLQDTFNENKINIKRNPSVKILLQWQGWEFEVVLFFNNIVYYRREISVWDVALLLKGHGQQVAKWLAIRQFFKIRPHNTLLHCTSDPLLIGSSARTLALFPSNMRIQFGRQLKYWPSVPSIKAIFILVTANSTHIEIKMSLTYDW